MRLQFSLVILFVTFASTLADYQCLTVRGQANCPQDAKKHNLIRAKFVNSDDQNLDDIIDIGYTSEHGTFHLGGCLRTMSGTRMRPAVKIYHNCKPSGEKMLTISLPYQQFMNGAYNITRKIDLSNIQLVGLDVDEVTSFGQVHPHCVQAGLGPRRARRDMNFDMSSDDSDERRQEVVNENADSDEDSFLF